MKTGTIQAAIESEALLNKSRLYVERALISKSEKNLDEYQLWASIALELLGKAALSKFHPSLVVDPTHYQSLFAAAGINLSTDVKTIAAKTLFERLAHISPRFDLDVRDFCTSLAQRRNVELHSGEAPFRLMKLEAWESRYWHACEVILSTMGMSIEEWIAGEKSTVPIKILKEAAEARRAAIAIRVEQAAKHFNEKKKSEREDLLKKAESTSAYSYVGLFSASFDQEWKVECPACFGQAVVAGMQVEEEIAGEPFADGETVWEPVERTYGAEEFHCPVCGLDLNSYDEIVTADVSTEHTELDEREMEWEPDYGND